MTVGPCNLFALLYTLSLNLSNEQTSRSERRVFIYNDALVWRLGFDSASKWKKYQGKHTEVDGVGNGSMPGLCSFQRRFSDEAAKLEAPATTSLSYSIP
jgi:hypothetical protein